MKTQSFKRGLFTFIAVMVVAVVLISVLFKDGSDENRNMATKSQSNYGRGEAAAPAPMPEATVDPGFKDKGGLQNDNDALKSGTSEESQSDLTLQERKIIKDATARIETKEFDKSIDAIDRLIKESGGFAESRNIQGNSMYNSSMRYATIVFRVPAEKFDTILKSMGQVGNVVNSTTNGTDITDQYVDSQTRVNNLKVQEQTLLKLMEKAEKIEDVISLETRLSDLRYQIESIENTLMNYDRLVQYSRISIDLAEVVEMTEEKPIARTFGDRIGETFKDSIDNFISSLENFVLWLIDNWILMVVILGGGVTLIIVYRRKQASKKKEVNLINQNDK